MNTSRITGFLISVLIQVLPTLRRSSEKQKSMAIEILLVNALVFLGVILGSWDIFFLMILYWCETLIYGLTTLFKLASSAINSPLVKKPVNYFLAAFHSIFFTIHFGAFMTVHLALTLVFLWISLKNQGGCYDFSECLGGYFNTPGIDNFSSLAHFILTNYTIEFSVLAALLIRCLHEFFSFDIKNHDKALYDPSNQWHVSKIMMAPYSRVVHMHVSLIFGGMFLFINVYGVFMALVWVIVKTYLDIKGDKNLF